MKVSDYIVMLLKQCGVKYIFGYQGANISHMIDSIYNSDDITFIETYNEQGAAFCANGISQISNGLGVAISSSGPGALNLLSGIADSYFDSIPTIFITGNVGLKGMRENENVRQNSFQELDIISMTKGITKFSYMVKDANEVPAIFSKAIKIAQSGRKGAVHIDLPHDIQKSDINISSILDLEVQNADKAKDDLIQFIEEYKLSLESSEKPLVLIGGGTKNAILKKSFIEFINQLNIPYVVSLKGLDLSCMENPNFVGFIGDYGNRYANLAIYKCDNLLILGSRLDHRQTGANIDDFAPNANIFRVEIDENEVLRIPVKSKTIVGDISDFVTNCNIVNHSNSFYEWKKALNEWKDVFSSYKLNTRNLHVNTYLRLVSKDLNEQCIVSCDVGQNQMAVAQSFFIKEKDHVLTSGGLGAMGYALPAAIGARFANPEAIIIAITGDGGFQMNIQELQLIQREKLNIKIIIINNNCLGMIRQYQKLALNQQYFGSVIGYENPNFASIANAYGFEYLKVENIKDTQKSIDFINSDRAGIVEVCISNEIELIPEMGTSIIKQTPVLESFRKICEDESI